MLMAKVAMHGTTAGKRKLVNVYIVLKFKLLKSVQLNSIIKSLIMQVYGTVICCIIKKSKVL